MSSTRSQRQGARDAFTVGADGVGTREAFCERCEGQLTGRKNCSFGRSWADCLTVDGSFLLVQSTRVGYIFSSTLNRRSQ